MAGNKRLHERAQNIFAKMLPGLGDFRYMERLDNWGFPLKQRRKRQTNRVAENMIFPFPLAK